MLGKMSASSCLLRSRSLSNRRMNHANSVMRAACWSSIVSSRLEDGKEERGQNSSAKC